VVVVDSRSAHAETLERLLAALAERDMTVFAQIDHAAAARGVGLELGPEVVVVFGNPRAGTLLMQDDRRVGLELPLRILVWEDAGGTHVGYEDPRELADAYELQPHAAMLEAMATLLAALAGSAAHG
jgi:uncharacterized protein (DUF302 family)